MMKHVRSDLLKAISLSAALLGAASFEAMLAVPTAVHADPGNGHGGGNGGGNGHGGGNGNGGGNGGGHGNGHDGGNSSGHDSGFGHDKSTAQAANGSSHATSVGTPTESSGASRLTEQTTRDKKRVQQVSTRLDGETLRPRQRPARDFADDEQGDDDQQGNVDLQGDDFQDDDLQQGDALVVDDGLRAHPSDLGALNAAHASPNALNHASPNSRVGRIAAYRDEVLEGQALARDYDAAKATLASLPEPDRPVAAINTDIAAARTQREATLATLADLNAQQDANTVPDPVLADKIDATINDLAAQDAAIASLRDERSTAVAYANAEDTVDTLHDELAVQPEIERSLLDAAANKPVTDAVEMEVRDMLGLNPPS